MFKFFKRTPKAPKIPPVLEKVELETKVGDRIFTIFFTDRERDDDTIQSARSIALRYIDYIRRQGFFNVSGGEIIPYHKIDSMIITDV